MTRLHVVLHYAPPPKSDRGIRRGLVATAYLIAVIIPFVILGAFIGQMVVRSDFVSRGVLWVEMAPNGNGLNSSPPTTQSLQSVVTTALRAAKKTPAGQALPSSVLVALGDATVAVGNGNGLVNISFKASDPVAATLMANEMIKAYMAPLIANYSGFRNPSSNTPPLVRSMTVLERPVAGSAIRNAGIALGGFAGATASFVLLLSWFLLRRSATKSAE